MLFSHFLPEIIRLDNVYSSIPYIIIPHGSKATKLHRHKKFTATYSLLNAAQLYRSLIRCASSSVHSRPGT